MDVGWIHIGPSEVGFMLVKLLEFIWYEIDGIFWKNDTFEQLVLKSIILKESLWSMSIFNSEFGQIALFFLQIKKKREEKEDNIVIW